MDTNNVAVSAEAIERELNDSLSIVELEERFEMEESSDRCRCVIIPV